MGVVIRELGYVMQAIEEMGLKVSYAYDDLVFIEHSAFLLQYSPEEQNNLLLFFNTDCKQEHRDELMSRVKEKFKEQKLSVTYKGDFTMSQNDDETLSLTFSEAVS